MAIKFNRDIPQGAIVTSSKGNKYMVDVDASSGDRFLFTKTGTFMRFDGDDLRFGKSGDGVVEKIQVFDTLPTADAISESIKLLYTGRTATSHMATVYTREDPAVTEAKNALAALQEQTAAANRKAADLAEFIRRNSR